jgi:hypothetical protein
MFPGRKIRGEFGHPTESVLLSGSSHVYKYSAPNHLASMDSPELAGMDR